MRSELSEEYKAALRELVARKGVPVQFEQRRYDWQDEDEVSTFGWTDYAAAYHCLPRPEKYPGAREYGGCEWVVEPGVKLKERTYSQFTDTDSSNEDEVGINVYPVSCRCGAFQGVTLRYTASLGETLRELFGPPDPRDKEIEL